MRIPTMAPVPRPEPPPIASGGQGQGQGRHKKNRQEREGGEEELGEREGFKMKERGKKES